MNCQRLNEDERETKMDMNRKLLFTLFGEAVMC
jgi:hypothetical protein